MLQRVSDGIERKGILKGENMREKLIELLCHALNKYNPCIYCVGEEHCDEVNIVADHLIANGVTVQRLIPVVERLPEKGGDYLCLCCIDGHTEYPFYMVLRYYIVDKNPHFQHESEHGLKVTHWMCLPDMPKDGDSE